MPFIVMRWEIRSFRTPERLHDRANFRRVRVRELRSYEFSLLGVAHGQVRQVLGQAREMQRGHVNEAALTCQARLASTLTLQVAQKLPIAQIESGYVARGSCDYKP